MKLSLLVALCVLTSACDLLHLNARIYCARADGNYAKCSARPDWCTTVGGPACRDCSGRYCGPTSPKACGELATSAASCPQDDRFTDSEGLKDLGPYKWLTDELSPSAIELSGKKLDPDNMTKLTEKDRQRLCGALDDNCRLMWNSQLNAPRCEYKPARCSSCVYYEEPVKCYPRNLCTGVICW